MGHDASPSATCVEVVAADNTAGRVLGQPTETSSIGDLDEKVHTSLEDVLWVIDKEILLQCFASRITWIDSHLQRSFFAAYTEVTPLTNIAALSP